MAQAEEGGEEVCFQETQGEVMLPTELSVADPQVVADEAAAEVVNEVPLSDIADAKIVNAEANDEADFLATLEGLPYMTQEVMRNLRKQGG